MLNMSVQNLSFLNSEFVINTFFQSKLNVVQQCAILINTQIEVIISIVDIKKYSLYMCFLFGHEIFLLEIKSLFSGKTLKHVNFYFVLQILTQKQVTTVNFILSILFHFWFLHSTRNSNSHSAILSMLSYTHVSTFPIKLNYR